MNAFKIRWIRAPIPGQSNLYRSAQLPTILAGRVNGRLAVFSGGFFRREGPVHETDYVDLQKLDLLEPYARSKRLDLYFTNLVNFENIPAVHVRGETYTVLGRLDEAAQSFSHILGKNPDDEMALVSLGYVRYLQRENDKAMNLLTKALEINPRNAHALYRLGNVHMAQRKFHDAKQCFMRLHHLDPYDLGALFGLGMVALKRGAVNEAERWFDRIIKFNCRHSFAYIGHAYILLGKKEYHEVEEKVHDLLKMDPNNSHAYAILAWVAILKRNFDKAWQLLRMSFKYNPNNLDAKDHSETLNVLQLNLSNEPLLSRFKNKNESAMEEYLNLSSILKAKPEKRSDIRLLKTLAQRCSILGFFNRALGYLYKAESLKHDDLETLEVILSCLTTLKLKTGSGQWNIKLDHYLAKISHVKKMSAEQAMKQHQSFSS